MFKMQIWLIVSASEALSKVKFTLGQMLVILMPSHVARAPSTAIRGCYLMSFIGISEP